MTMTLEAPTMVHDAFRLSCEGSHVRKPWSRTGAVRKALARPCWTERDRVRLERISGRFDDSWNYDTDEVKRHRHTCGYWKGTEATRIPCQSCEMIRAIDEQVKQWDRIREAPSIPSTAQLRNALRRPDRAIRAIRLYRELSGRLDARKRTILDGIKKYKTYAVRLKHERIAEESDPGLRRINRAIEKVLAIQPDVRYLARANHP